MRAWKKRLHDSRDQDRQKPMRFIIGDQGEIYFPIDFLRTSVRPPDGVNPPMPLPPTTINGANAESVRTATASGEMNDLLLPDGDPVFVWHDHVTTFDYTLSPIPGLTLIMGPDSSSVLEFENAVIVDWTTARDYSPEHPNEELCDFYWDGQQHFLLQFLSFNIILRAESLRIGHTTD